MIDPQLKDKVVLVTGANHGIGAATAKAFAEQDTKVGITFYREPCPYSKEELEDAVEAGIGGDRLFRALQQQSAEPLVQHIQSLGGVAVAREADLADIANIPMLFDWCEAELGPVDILVSNHTYDVLETFDPATAADDYRWFGEYPVQLTSAEIIDANFAVNARAYALMMTEYLQRYLKRKASWGRIINISTDAAHAHAANVSYAASKHAIESYSRSAAIEMGKYGITVNIVAPGPIQTGYMTPEMVTELTKDAPLRRVGEPEDVADAIVFLASEQARWLTGQLIYVGGGWRMHQ
ncbi:MAG: SDR family oxidoreductase [Fidelibacterota bacterium]|nr:MAG: SDR family oxidoreductase [Candidatus Neomarinimicrobiota bacterium]